MLPIFGRAPHTGLFCPICCWQKFRRPGGPSDTIKEIWKTSAFYTQKIRNSWFLKKSRVCSAKNLLWRRSVAVFFSKLFFLTILENFTKNISAEGSPSSSEVLYFGAELVFERLPSNINNYYLQLLPKCNFSCTSTGKVCSRKYSICARADFKFVFANTIAIVCARYMYSRIPHYIMYWQFPVKWAP